MRQRQRLATFALAGLCVLAAGCGDDEDFANEPRPPKPIVITSSVAADGITVSPARFGAGEVMLKVVNQTDSSQSLILRNVTGGVQQRTAPINPADATSITADLRQGRYELAVDGAPAIDAATITVGPQRPSAQNQLLQP